MISRVIEWCASNRFLVFIGVLVLVFGRHLVTTESAAGCLTGHLRCAGHSSHLVAGTTSKCH